MTTIRRVFLIGLIFFCLATPGLAVETSVDPGVRIAELEAQNRELHQQLRQARRQLAQTRNAEQQPGWMQVFGGVGIIFGLCGIAMMLGARKKN